MSMKMVLFASLASLALCTGAQAQVWDGGYNPNPKHRHLKQSLKRVHRDSLRAPPPVNQTTPSVQVNSATQTIGAQTQGTNINAATNFAVRQTTSLVQVNSATQTATATATQTQGTNINAATNFAVQRNVIGGGGGLGIASGLGALRGGR